MFKSLLSVCSIFVLLFPSIFLPAIAEACPVKSPETLLSLYRNSDAIYVARFDKVEDHEIIENTDERTVLNIKKHFDISSTLKGEPKKLFVLEEQEYRYKAADEQPAEESSEEEENPYGAANLKSGDLLLLFLKKGEDGKTLELTDYRDAVKKMTPARLDAYEARVRELNSIFAAKKADDAAIIEWLIRCAQDPATRWEGAYQFQQSFQQLKWLEQQKLEVQEETPEGSSPTEEAETEGAEPGVAEGEVDESEEVDFDETVFARLLTDTQKQQLMDILLERRQTSDDSEAKDLSVGDRVLIDVVSNWGDNRFAKFLLGRLQAASDEPYFVQEMMSTVANVLSDDRLEKIAARFSDVYYQDDDAFVEKEETEVSTETATAADADADGKETASPKNAPEERTTYKQLRAELLGEFIDRALVAIAIADSKQQSEKASQ